MQRSFLGAPTGRVPNIKESQAQQATVPDTAPGATQQPQAPPAQQEPLTLSPEQWAKNFEQCLALLNGPGDERRFVGLLLATKLLPQGGDDAIRRVLQALGWTFISRLLLPLTGDTAQAGKGSTPQTPAEHEAEQERQHQAVLSAGLGLSIVSAACRLPDVAPSAEALQQVPALVRVVVAGGVTPVLGTTGTSSTPSASPSPAAAGGLQDQNPADEEAVSEALESLLSMASASASEGAGPGVRAGGVTAALRRAGALQAVCTALARAAQRVTAAPTSGSKQQQSAPRPASPWHMPVLAARLLSLLLEEDAAAGRRAAILSEHEAQVAQAVPALAHLLGSHAVLQAAQQATAHDAAAAAAQSGGGQGSQQGSDAAVLLLECLHALLLVVPLLDSLPHLAQAAMRTALASSSSAGQKGAHTHKRLKGAGVGHKQGGGGGEWEQGWAEAAHRGLGWVLRSRGGDVQRHSALQLAAALVTLLGPQWLLLKDSAPPTPTAGKQPKPPKQQQEEPLLAMVLGEVLNVELGLLLHDALHPGAAVAQGARGVARAEWEAPAPSEDLMEELRERAETMDLDAAAPTQQQLQQQQQEQQQLEQVLASELGAAPAPSSSNVTITSSPAPEPAGVVAAGVSTAHPVDQASSSIGGAPKMPQPRTRRKAAGAVTGARFTAGERALARLPAVCSLIEYLIDGLAQDARAAEEEEERGGHGAAPMDDDLDSDGDDQGGSTQAGGWVHIRGPLLSAAQQAGLLQSLGRAIDACAAFLEAAGDVTRAAVGGGESARASVTQDTGAQPQPGASNGGSAGQGGGVNGSGGPQAPPPAGRPPRDSFGFIPPSISQAADQAERDVGLRPPVPEVVLSITRVVGRFLADAPEAHTPALRRALPYLLDMRAVVAAARQQGGSNQAQGVVGQDEGMEDAAVRFLTPGLLQATSAASPDALDLRRVLCDSHPALAALVAHLTRATSLASQLADRAAKLGLLGTGAPGSKPGGTRSAGQEEYSRGAGTETVLLSELQDAEAQVADAAMLLLNIVDTQRAAPALSAAAAALRGSSSKAPKSGTTAAPRSSDLGPGEAAGASKGDVLAPVTRALLPAVTALGEWASSRGPRPSQPPAHPSAGGPAGREMPGPTACLQQLAEARLHPRALLCSACLTGVVLEAVVVQVQQAAAAASKASLPSGHTVVTLQQVIPPGALKRACDLAARGVGCGLMLATAALMEEMSPGSHFAAAGATPATAQRMSDVLDGAAGDGEQCWERLTQAVAGIVGPVPQMAAALAQRVPPGIEEVCGVTLPASLAGASTRQVQQVPQQQQRSGGGASMEADEDNDGLPPLEPISSGSTAAGDRLLAGISSDPVAGASAAEDSNVGSAWWQLLLQVEQAADAGEVPGPVPGSATAKGHSAAASAAQAALPEVVTQSTGLRLLLRALTP